MSINKNDGWGVQWDGMSAIFFVGLLIVAIPTALLALALWLTS